MSLNANCHSVATFLGGFYRRVISQLGWGNSSIFRRCKANSSWDCVRICATDTPGCGGEIHFEQELPIWERREDVISSSDLTKTPSFLC